MWYPRREVPEPGPLPAGYAIRTYQAGDEPGWAALLQANGELGAWDLARVGQELAGPLLRQAQFFVVMGNELAATTGVYDRQRPDGSAWEIGWVAVHPAHRGRGLGNQVVAAALRAALALPCRPIYLLTDDHRLPALKVYLGLGFQPDLGHPSYPDRWERLFAQLGNRYRQPPIDRQGALSAGGEIP